MKTPTELAQELRDTCSDPHPKGGIMLYPEAVESFMARAQLEAYKAGMAYAAKLAERKLIENRSVYTVYGTVIAAADDLKKLP